MAPKKGLSAFEDPSDYATAHEHLEKSKCPLSALLCIGEFVDPLMDPRESRIGLLSNLVEAVVDLLFDPIDTLLVFIHAGL